MESNTGPVEQGSSNILQTFWGLSSLEEQEQLSAAKQLIVSLNEAQVCRVFNTFQLTCDELHESVYYNLSTQSIEQVETITF